MKSLIIVCVVLLSYVGFISYEILNERETEATAQVKKELCFRIQDFSKDWNINHLNQRLEIAELNIDFLSIKKKTKKDSVEWSDKKDLLVRKHLDKNLQMSKELNVLDSLYKIYCIKEDE